MLNLVMASIGIMLGVVTGIRVMLLSQQEDDEFSDRDEVEKLNREEYRREKRKMEEYARTRFVWLVMTLIMAIMGILLFILTEDMRLPMILADKWTLIHIIIISIEVVAVLFAFRRTEYTEYYYEDESLPHLS